MTTLLSFHDVIVRGPEGLQVGPITWEIARPGRIWLECEHPRLLELLVGLLTGEKQPAAGRMRESGGITVQTDAHLKSALNPNRTIADFLHSPEAPEYVWIEQRRRSVGVLLERLGLSPQHLRRPLKMASEAVTLKYLALRFLTSRADLLIGGEIFRTADPLIQAGFRMRWADIASVVIVAAPRELLPGAVTHHARLDAAGHFRIEPAPAALLAESRP